MDARVFLERRRNADGGFGPVEGAPSEAEPTALAALALDDGDAARWLESATDERGAVGVVAGTVFRDQTAVATLAMRDPDVRAAAVAWVLAARGRSEPSSPAVPLDGALHGWSWTSDTFGWIEPTSWGILALRAAGITDPALEDGIAVLRDRACVGGGWNYGNRIVLGEALPPYVQTTALALLALHGLEGPVVEEGIGWLGSAWRSEADGLLSTAVATCAYLRYGHPEAAPARAVLSRLISEHPAADTVAVAWSAIAIGDGLGRIEVD
jgi:hypothetical protein